MIRFENNFIGSIGSMLDKLIQAKAALWWGKLLSAVGLGFVAQEFVYDPLIDQVAVYWNAVPARAAMWLHAIGIDTGVSIILSAWGLKGVERVFFARRNSNV